MRELIVDSFAGGGGASTGIEMALGRSPDYAINHDAEALAMHEANHPDTIHLASNIWKVDPADVAKGRPVGLLWASPDCKHFSKAKGGKPVARNIRDLAWVVVLWAKRARPRVIVLENVEEFQDWGPLVVRDGPDRKGATFAKFVGELRRLGYKVDWRELRACDYGAPTIRKRLFLIARRDGRPIVWPAATHGDPASEDVIAGQEEARRTGSTGKHKKPWRTAAECIDWSLPCPSIFMTREEAKAYHRATGTRVNRPLAEATMARIARGVKRYVLDAAEPFIVGLGGRMAQSAERPVGKPMQTHTAKPDSAIVVPTIAPFASYGQQGGGNRSAGVPHHTITASAKDTNAVVAPFLVPRYGERQEARSEATGKVRKAQEPRSQSAETPMSTVVPTGNGAGVVAAFLAQHNTDMVGHDARKPVSTIVGKGCTQGVVAAHMLNMRGADRRDSPAGSPAPTFTGGGNHAALVASFLIKYYGQGVGARLDEPMHTETTRDRFGLVALEIAGAPYVIVDVGMRMLTPRERFRAQGFPGDYIIDTGADGRRLTGAAQGRMCGNSVCPPAAAAIVAANCPDLAVVEAGEAAT